jgi:hypothetical protein
MTLPAQSEGTVAAAIDKEEQENTITNDLGAHANGIADAQDQSLVRLSKLRKSIVLFVFCLALFADAFQTSGMLVCLDDVRFGPSRPCFY